MTSITLTKKQLLHLPPGLFLVSNCMKTPVDSIFAERIAPKADRAAQWHRIVDAGANGRLCHVFTSAAAADDYYTQLAGITLDPQRN